MDVSNAANMLAGSILVMIALVVIVIGIVAINNIFAKYWQPVRWMNILNHPMYETREDPVVEHKEFK